MMKFVKYQGTGNDFILLDGKDILGKDKDEVARRVCDRKFGIGADGLLFAEKSEIADIKMNYYNQDGTIATMCGNGLRCFGRHVHETGIVAKDNFTVETLAGVLKVSIKGSYKEIAIELGNQAYKLSYPNLSEEEVGKEKLILEVNGRAYEMYVLFLGTLHGVVITNQEVSEDDASKLCHHQAFPKRINVNFVEVMDIENISVKTYERGVGFTLSCGTGSGASFVITEKLGLTGKEGNVHIDGGRLRVKTGNPVILTGPAVKIAEGEILDEEN